MLEQLGKDLAEEFEDVEFIGVQHGAGYHSSICLFNCTKTGATFSGNNLDTLQERLDFVRENMKPTEK